MPPEDMNPIYREAMNVHLGDNHTEEDERIWQGLFTEEFQQRVAKAKTRDEAEDLTLAWAVSEIKKSPDGSERIRKVLEGRNEEEKPTVQ